MIKNAPVATGAVLVLTAPTFAATSNVAQKPNTTSCSVVSTKPDGKTMMMMGKNTYKTSAAAQSAMKLMTNNDRRTLSSASKVRDLPASPRGHSIAARRFT